MPLIEKIIPLAGNEVQGVFRITQPSWHASKIDELYCRCRIEDVTGSKIMHFIEPEKHDFQLLEDQAIASITAHYEKVEGKLTLIGETIQQPEKRPHSTLLLPASVCNDKTALNELMECIRAIRHPLLITFMDNVFWDMDIALPYLTVPASYRHHHARPSGLLTHSVEVAKLCRLHQSVTEAPYYSLLICAALLHDIGKVWTHNPDKPQSVRRLLNHEHLALEILAQPLLKLEKEWEEGANALRYLLTWKSSARSPFPVLPIMNILRMADQMSSASDVEQQAFNRSAQGQSIVRHPCPGPVNEFWRIA